MPGFVAGGVTIATYAHPLNDYAPIVDSTTEMPAAAGNAAMADTAGLTRMSPRCYAQLLINGSTTLNLVASSSMWLPVTPTVSRVSAGLYTIYWSSLQSDEIPSGYPGYTGPTAIGLRGGFANAQSTVTPWWCQVTPVNVFSLNLAIFNASGTAADPSTLTTFDVFGF